MLVELFLGVTTYVYLNAAGPYVQTFPDVMMTYEECKDWQVVRSEAMATQPLVNILTGEPLLARYYSCVVIPLAADVAVKEQESFPELSGNADAP